MKKNSVKVLITNIELLPIRKTKLFKKSILANKKTPNIIVY